MLTGHKNLLEHPLGPFLIELKERIMEVKNPGEKFELLLKTPLAQEYICENPSILKEILTLSEKEREVIGAVLALGQGEELFEKKREINSSDLKKLAELLLPVEQFYKEYGGIVGYHLLCLKLLGEKEKREKKGNYYAPIAIDLAKENATVDAFIWSGIRHLDQCAEIYPLGGAADRLSLNQDLKDPFQIAATFEFCEKTLLERLIEDLQAREFLYYKLFGKQIRIPVVIMTSDEKGGTRQIRTLFEENQWFGRKEEDFFLFSQPLVPAMNTQGKWCVKGHCTPLLKPGGHGVIWKLAKESGALEWLRKKKKTKALVRQINNPIASVDYGLLAFLGIGFEEDKDFGFAACPCAPGASEGVNVVIEKGEGKCLTNIEYCDFEHFQIDPIQKNLLANTNLLFVGIDSIEPLLKKCLIPGMLVNKKVIKYRINPHLIKEEEVLRLESTMQNLADALIETGDPTEKMSKSYITTNRREKTISSIKKEFAFGSSMGQTPEQCFLDFLKNGRDLLLNRCGFELPPLRDPMTFFRKGPSFIFLYHPALGPTYQIISQKIRGGRLALESEFLLEIEEVDIENLSVEGSLKIVTESVMGHRDAEGTICYSLGNGKCTLKDVNVVNSGIDREASRSFWKDEIVHKEQCEIILEEGSEFFAEGVTLKGDIQIRVPKETKMVAKMRGEELYFIREKITSPTWHWEYSFTPEKEIKLERST